MMGRPVVQAILAILLTLALSQSSKGEANAAEQIEHAKQSHEIQASSMENSVFRIARDAKRRTHTRRKGNNQNKKKSDRERKKLGQDKKNRRKNNKMGQNKNNKMKLRKKGKKNKKQLRKTKKKITKKREKSRRKKIRSKKDRQNKKNSGQKQKSKKNKKKIRTGSKSFQEKIKKNGLSKWEAKQTCNEVALCQKIKDYIKISNQLRKVRRIVKSCDTMDRKANKSASEFEATVTALETAIGSSSGRRMYRSRWRRASEADDVTSIKDKLKNCSVTAKAKCQKSSVAPCQEEANLTKCENELQGWLTKFGPSKGSCLQASSDCCACITALPDVSKDCLAFDKKSTMAVDSKKKCTGGDEEGSFGFCKKLQIEAAEKGPKHAKDNCKPTGVTTTKGPKEKSCGQCSDTLECPTKCPYCWRTPGHLFGKCYKYPESCGECSNTLQCPISCPYCWPIPGSKFGEGNCYKYPEERCRPGPYCGPGQCRNATDKCCYPPDSFYGRCYEDGCECPHNTTSDTPGLLVPSPPPPPPNETFPNAFIDSDLICDFSEDGASTLSFDACGNACLNYIYGGCPRAVQEGCVAWSYSRGLHTCILFYNFKLGDVLPSQNYDTGVFK